MDIEVHRRNYLYNNWTEVPDFLPSSVVKSLADRTNQCIREKKVALVQHSGLGGPKQYDEGGDYIHYIFRGPDIRSLMPELYGVYVALPHYLSVLTSQEVITSPYPESDISMRVYPPGGGTIGWHKDTNGISVLLYLTTNTEGALVMEIEKEIPPFEKTHVVTEKVLARAGSLIALQGRRVRHYVEPMQHETKMSVILNYYVQGDTWRPENFDKFIYDGVDPNAKTTM